MCRSVFQFARTLSLSLSPINLILSVDDQRNEEKKINLKYKCVVEWIRKVKKKKKETLLFFFEKEVGGRAKENRKKE